jgi:uncharacterized membrane protein (UPF0127 family)
MKKFILITVGILLIVTGYFYIRHPIGAKVIINGHTITVEVAVTESEKQKGLGDRDMLALDSGILFVYQNRDRYGFWMKGMRFPLDYIWVSGNTVVDLSADIPAPATPDEQPVELSPVEPVDKVLEVNAGTIKRLGIQTGDIVRFTN